MCVLVISFIFISLVKVFLLLGYSVMSMLYLLKTYFDHYICIFL